MTQEKKYTEQTNNKQIKTKKMITENINFPNEKTIKRIDEVNRTIISLECDRWRQITTVGYCNERTANRLNKLHKEFTSLTKHRLDWSNELGNAKYIEIC